MDLPEISRVKRRRPAGSFLRGFGRLTLDPSPRLRAAREELELVRVTRLGVPLPPLPESCYPPGAVPLDTSGVP
jgi:hypothetical protein